MCLFSRSPDPEPLTQATPIVTKPIETSTQLPAKKKLVEEDNKPLVAYGGQGQKKQDSGAARRTGSSALAIKLNPATSQGGLNV
tara:strand:+ start:376 stop:627 length:252 start_codon:yes stop_codon:yes gene_type:complete